jgi:DNA polymerase/3'-5' exonuclease PolX
MSNFFDKSIQLIQQLIQYQLKQLDTPSDKETTTGIQFKIKNYQKWLDALTKYIKTNNPQINNIDDIKILNFSKISPKLEKRLIEIYETDTLSELSTVHPSNDAMSPENTEANTPKIPENRKRVKKQENTKKINTISKDFNADISTSNASGTSNENGTSNKIENIPKILEAEARPKDARGAIIWDLRLIHGIGPANAIKLADNGLTLEGLLKEWDEWTRKDPQNAVLLTSQMQCPFGYSPAQWNSLDADKKIGILESNLQKRLKNETTMLSKIHRNSLVGLKHFHDMGKKIPRAEIERAEIILKHVASHLNKDIIVMLCGSYRRGKDKSGDIDCFITHQAIKTKNDLEHSEVNILSSFVESLIKVGFIIDQLDMGQVKFMGFCKVQQKKNTKTKDSTTDSTTIIQPIARRIDIRFVPADSFGSAILYFTGSKNFNTKLRTHAMSKGYSLSEFGLKRKSDDVLIPCSTEEEVFKILNYPYLTPKERDI